MDNLPEEKQWSKEEKAEFRKFWESPIGKKYIQRIKDSKEGELDICMGVNEPDVICRHAGIANGFNSILLDIEYLGKTEEELKKEKKEREEAAKKKK